MHDFIVIIQFEQLKNKYREYKGHIIRKRHWDIENKLIDEALK